MKEQFKKLQEIQTIQQRSSEWYQARYNMLTSSDVAAALEANPYKTKKQLLVGACVIDSGYDGEVFINLHNVGKQTHWFSDGDKVAQGVLIPINLCEIVEVSDPSELNKDSTRGEGALGSTGSR